MIETPSTGRWQTLCLSLIFVLSAVFSEARTRFHEYTEQFYSPQDVARPVVASYVGGGSSAMVARYGGDYRASWQRSRLLYLSWKSASFIFL